MHASTSPAWLTIDDIAASVRRLLGSEAAVVTDWRCRKLAGGAGEDLGVWRLEGHALLQGTSRRWSVILKGWSAPGPETPPSAWNWPHREMELYRSGLLADLPGGNRAPTCYGTVERPDGTAWAWLEDIADGQHAPWSLDDYARAAGHLGRLNGSFLADGRLPASPWLSRRWLRGWVETATDPIAALRSAADHPVIRRIFPPHVVEAYARLWARRHAAYAFLDDSPQTFCHLDAFRRNLFFPATPAESSEMVLIDWGFAGIAAVGEDLTPLIVASLLFLEVPAEEATRLQETVLQAYVEGLREAGWRGDPDAVRTAYALSAGLRYGAGVLRVVLPWWLDDALHPWLERMLGRPFEEIVTTVAAVHAWLAGLVPDA